MAPRWSELRLGDVCQKIGSGATPRGGSSVYLDRGDVALIRSQNIYNDGFHYDGLVYLTEKHAAELANVEVVPGDVLVNITGDSVARVCQAPVDVLPARVNQHVAIVRPDANQLSPLYLRYYLTSPEAQAELLSLAGAGATRSALTKGMIEAFRIAAPVAIAEQRAIASILGSLDDKIELNRRRNRTLESLARALFQSWFVDFDPVRAKLDGRRPAGMGEATAKLFPNTFTDSSLGPIPTGWSVECVGDVVECVGSGTPSTKEPAYWDDGIHHWTTPKDFSALQSPFLIDTARKLTAAGLAKISSGLLPAGTLLLSSRAPVGYLAIATMPVAINQGFIAMKCNERVTNYFMLNWCQSNLDEIQSRATGTTFPEISKQRFRPILFLLPSAPLVSAFTKTVSPLYDQIVTGLWQSRTLAALRDSLLPKLISGELRVAEAERIVEDVA